MNIRNPTFHILITLLIISSVFDIAPKNIKSRIAEFSFPVLPSSCLFQSYDRDILDNEAVNKLWGFSKSWREAKSKYKISQISSKLPHYVVSGDSGTYVVADQDSYIKAIDDESFFLVTEKYANMFDRNATECYLSCFKNFNKIWEMDVLKYAQIYGDLNLIVISSKLFYFTAKVDDDYLLFICSLENGKIVKIFRNYSHIIRKNEHIALLKWRSNGYVLSLDSFEILFELPGVHNIFYSQGNRIIATLPNAEGNIEDYPKVLIHDANTGKIMQELNVTADTFKELGKSHYLISFQGVIGNTIFGITNFVGERNRYVFGYDLGLNRLVFARDTGCERDLNATCDEKYIYYRINAGIVCLNPEKGDIVWTEEMPAMFGKTSVKNGQLTLDKAIFDSDGSVKEGLHVLRNNSWNLALKADYDERAFFKEDSKKGSFHMTDHGMLYFSPTQKKPIELYDFDSWEKKLSVSMPSWGADSNADFSICGDSMFVNTDGSGFYEIDLIHGNYNYYDFKLKPAKDNSGFNAKIVAGTGYVFALSLEGKIMLQNRKNKEIKTLANSPVAPGKMAIRGNFLYIIGDNHSVRISLADGVTSNIGRCVIDSVGRIVFDSGDVIDIDGTKNIRLFAKNEASTKSRYCGKNYYIDGNNTAMSLDNNKQLQNLISGDSCAFISDGNALYDWDGDRLIKYDKCPSYSVTSNGVANGIMRFRLQMTTGNKTSKPLVGKAYFKQCNENNLIKLDGTSVEFGPLRFEEENNFEFEIPDGTPSGTKFALVIESNGLLDTEKSNFDHFAEIPQYLNAYEGVPISFLEQKSIVILPMNF